MAIENSSATDVSVVWNHATTYVQLKGNCFVYTSFSVVNTSTCGNTLQQSSTSERGVSIRVVATTDGNEASIGHCNYTDSRGAAAGDMWVAGVNCWTQIGYSIGSPILNHCLNIASDGNLSVPHIVKTPEMMVDILRGMIADQI